MRRAASPISWSNPSGLSHSLLKRTTRGRTIQDLEGLRFVGSSRFHDLLAREARAHFVLARGIADHRREVADQEDHLVAEFLKLPHFLDQHGVTDMQIRPRRIEPGLDPERSPFRQPIPKLVRLMDLDDAAR